MTTRSTTLVNMAFLENQENIDINNCPMIIIEADYHLPSTSTDTSFQSEIIEHAIGDVAFVENIHEGKRNLENYDVQDKMILEDLTNMILHGNDCENNPPQNTSMEYGLQEITDGVQYSEVENIVEIDTSNNMISDYEKNYTETELDRFLESVNIDKGGLEVNELENTEKKPVQRDDCF